MMDKKKLFIAGVGVVLLLIVINSVKPPKLREISEDSEPKNFDSGRLPDTHKPPAKLNDGEPLPQRRLPMKNFSNIVLKPRFDT
jgi:hypothetical protein